MVDGNATSFKTTPGSNEQVNIMIHSQAQGSGVGEASRSILALSKPAMMGAGLLALGALGVGLFSMIRIPGLQDQIEELESEIDRLEAEITVLVAENDRYEILNADLNETLYDLVTINEDLNETATLLQDSVDELNATVTNLTFIADDLQSEADSLQGLNKQLRLNQVELRSGLDQLGIANVTYTELNAQLRNTSDSLSNEVTVLQNTNNELVNTTQGLNASITALQGQNDELGVVVEDLTIINEYFTVWNVDTSDQLSTVQAQLDSNTQLYRSNTFLALNSYYDTLIQQWDCLDNVVWYDQEFYQNRTAPVFDTLNGPQNLAQLLEELDNRMMAFMCLDLENFKAFMEVETGKSLSQVSYNEYSLAVSNFGNRAMDYYGLPVPGNPTVKVITEQQWEEASFDCKLLSSPYRWSGS